MRLGLILGVLAVLQSQVVCAASYESLQRKCQQKMAENPPQITVEYSFGKLNISLYYIFSSNTIYPSRCLFQMNIVKLFSFGCTFLLQLDL